MSANCDYIKKCYLHMCICFKYHAWKCHNISKKILVAKSKCYGNTMSHSCRVGRAKRQGGTDPPDKSTLFNFYSFFFFDKSIRKPKHAKNTAEKCWNEFKNFLEPNHCVGKVKELCKYYFHVPFSLHIGFCLFEGWLSGPAGHTKNFYSRWD